MAEEKKTRQRITITTMQQAIFDIEEVIREKSYFGDRGILLRRDGQNFYIASLGYYDEDEKFFALHAAESSVDYESAVANLLERMKEKLEEKKKALITGLDSVLEKHHGALKGARSKIREKKT